MHVDQGTIFAESEADRWFERNQSGLERCDWQQDMPLRLMELYRLCPRAVLDIGASNGYRLAAIVERYGSRGVAVEPSAQAICDGRERFPDVQFIRATADAIDLHATFDLVIVNFVLHWVDRSRLMRTVAQIDRLLVDGGFLIIGDFFPERPARAPYHHLPEGQVFTYKQDYAAVFLASGLYRQVGMLTGDHASAAPEANGAASERIATWLLRKDLQEQYEKRSHAPR